jgi:hypothetical protein
VRALLAKLDLPGGRWLEPGAGDGAIVRAVLAKRSDLYFTAIELRAVSDRPRDLCDWWTGDFLEPDLALLTRGLSAPFAVAIGNPPYSRALEFILAAMKHAKIVCFLLRLDFLGSRRRLSFWREHPADIYVLPDRPSFVLSVKCKRCDWRMTLPLTNPRPTSCGNCSNGKLQISTTDANEYAWFVWPGTGRYSHLDSKPKSSLSNCRDCGEFLTHGHDCMPKMIIVDQQSDEPEAQARARTVQENAENGYGEKIVGNSYVLADGRLVLFEGTASHFSFFAGTQASGSAKFRVETKDVQAWPCEGSGVECPACKWVIADEAAENAAACPHCGAQ